MKRSEFATILAQKMEQITEERASSFNYEPTWMFQEQLSPTYRTEVTKRLSFIPPQVKLHYKRPKSVKKKSTQKCAKKVTSEIYLYSSRLTVAEQMALFTLQSLGAKDLQGEKFSLTMLKKIFRQLAFQFHPDTSATPNPEKFDLLKESYDLLIKAAHKQKI